MTTTTVYYHANCLDGFGAAYAAWSHFGNQARYLPMQHGESWHADDVTGKAVYILDFSFPVTELRAMAALARSVLLLDHHISARQPWAAHLQTDCNGLATLSDPDLPLTVAFDLDKSGAQLAWEHFQPERSLPLLVQHIADQDLWRFALPGSRAFCRALRLQAFDFQAWENIVRTTPTPDAPAYQALLTQGEAIERFCALEVSRLAQSQLVMPATLHGEAIDPLQALRHGLPVIHDGVQSWRGLDGLAINASALFDSDLGHQLAAQSGTFGLIWQLTGQGMVKVSLRADGKVNVARLAEQYGGGGHPNAAGFRISAARFFAEILHCPADNSPSNPV